MQAKNPSTRDVVANRASAIKLLYTNTRRFFRYPELAADMLQHEHDRLVEMYCSSMRTARTPRAPANRHRHTKQSTCIMEHGFLFKQAYRGTGGQKDSRTEVTIET